MGRSFSFGLKNALCCIFAHPLFSPILFVSPFFSFRKKRHFVCLIMHFVHTILLFYELFRGFSQLSKPLKQF